MVYLSKQLASCLLEKLYEKWDFHQNQDLNGKKMKYNKKLFYVYLFCLIKYSKPIIFCNFSMKPMRLKM